MALSEYERKMLEELEAQLAGEDPKFADTLKPETAPLQGKTEISLRNLVLGLLISVVGIAVLIAGVAIELVIVGVAGILVMFAGFWFIGAGVKTSSERVEGSAKKPAKPAATKNFMDRQSQEWDRRRNEGK